MNDKLNVLKDVFGHSSFRPGQEQAVDCLLSGRDLMAVMPTGAGKSLCYQLPALMFPGITLIVSPLISLMKDQVMSLKQNGVPAAFINSSLSYEDFVGEIRKAARGEYKILFVAPERLENTFFVDISKKLDISMVTVDEAHCVSQWGQDFRPCYLHIADYIKTLPKRPVMGAFTATATETVRKDTIEKLGLASPMEIVTGFDRPNLYFRVIKPAPNEKDKVLLGLLEEFSDRCGIIYCSTRKYTRYVYELCLKNGISAAMYHAGMADERRKISQEDFIYDRVRVMAATNAFGMGIDKSNVGFVIHYNMPKSPEAYYQEAGRAGRDGTAADCVLLYSAGDVNTARYFIDNMSGEGLTHEQLQEVKKQETRRLNAMTGYCTSNSCLREYLLDYFGEKCAVCSGCSNCSAVFREEDITEEAQKIISCVFRLGQRRLAVGASTLADALRGAKTEKTARLRLDELSTYGIMSGYKSAEIRDLVDALVNEGFLARTDDKFRLLTITEKGHRAVKEREKIIIRRREEASAPKRNARASESDNALLEKLKALRLKLARERNVPAYIVFSNAALEDMALRRPSTEREFLQVNGVGDMKLQLYGEEFLTAIKEFEKLST